MIIRSAIWVAAVCSFGFLQGCVGAAAHFSLGCSPHTVQLTFPTVAGYAAVRSLTSATRCFTTTHYTTLAGLHPIVGSVYAGGTTSLVYLGIDFASNEYANGLPALAITIPLQPASASRQYFVTSNASNGSLFAWTTPVRGQLDPSLRRLSFPASGGNVTFTANQTVEFFAYAVDQP